MSEADEWSVTTITHQFDSEEEQQTRLPVEQETAGAAPVRVAILRARGR